MTSPARRQNARVRRCSARTTNNAAAKCTSLNNGFAWDHGYYAPEIDTTWLGVVGPGVAHKGVDGLGPADGPSSADGANANPQLVQRGREEPRHVGRPHRHPADDHGARRSQGRLHDRRSCADRGSENSAGQTGDKKFQALAVCYKQLNSSVGQFGTDVLVADTAALKTGSSSDDSAYQAVASKIKAWEATGRPRDEIKNDLFNAEFNNTSIPRSEAIWTDCENIVAQANAPGGTGLTS